MVQILVEYCTAAENSSGCPYGFLPQAVVLEHVQLLAVEGLSHLCFQALHGIVILLPPPTECFTSSTCDFYQTCEDCNNSVLFGGEMLSVLLL